MKDVFTFLIVLATTGVLAAMGWLLISMGLKEAGDTATASAVSGQIVAARDVPRTYTSVFQGGKWPTSKGRRTMHAVVYTVRLAGGRTVEVERPGAQPRSRIGEALSLSAASGGAGEVRWQADCSRATWSFLAYGLSMQMPLLILAAYVWTNRRRHQPDPSPL